MMQIIAEFITKLNLKDRSHKFLDKWLFGYGVRYQNPLLLGIFIIFLFSIPFWFQEAGGLEKIRVLCLDQAKDSYIEALRLSSLSFISSPQGRNFYNLFGIIERTFGVIITSAFTVTLAKKILR